MKSSITLNAMTIAEEKSKLRAEYKALRAKLSEHDRLYAGQAITMALFSPKLLNLLERYQIFTSYLHLRDEMPTDEIHHALFQANKMVGVPRYSEDHQSYRWAHLRPGEPLVRGRMKIMEPISTDHFPRDLVEVALIPGLAFDTRGARLGYGGGIYDRLLKDLRPGVLKIALAFDCQVSSSRLPQASHDLSMDYIVTESHWIDCRTARSAQKR